MTVKIMVGDALATLRELPDRSVHCVITSPPYWGLRAYCGDPGMIGLEPTFEEHLVNLVEVFREIRRVLRTDGTCWLNYGSRYATGDTLSNQNRQLGHVQKCDNGYTGLLNCQERDCVCSGLCGECQDAIRSRHARTVGIDPQNPQSLSAFANEGQGRGSEGCSQPEPSHPAVQESNTQQSSQPPLGACSPGHSPVVLAHPSPPDSSSAEPPLSACRGCGLGIPDTSGLQQTSDSRTMGNGSSFEAYKRYLSTVYHKSKDLMDMPAMVAEALRSDGWWLRSEIIWHKPNPMPESVTDRPTSAHEKIFLLTKAAKYFYDAEAVRTSDAAYNRYSA